MVKSSFDMEISVLFLVEQILDKHICLRIKNRLRRRIYWDQIIRLSNEISLHASAADKYFCFSRLQRLKKRKQRENLKSPALETYSPFFDSIRHTEDIVCYDVLTFSFGSRNRVNARAVDGNVVWLTVLYHC